MGNKRANIIDIAIGKKINALRVAQGLTMQQFAGAIGVTQQQAHKYEKGLNRVSVSRLVFIAEVLNVSASYFFEELEKDMGEIEIGGQVTLRPRRNMDLIKYFQSIPNMKHQDAISILVRVLSETAKA